MGIERTERRASASRTRESERLEKKLMRLYELWSEGNDTLMVVIHSLEEKLRAAKKREAEEAERELERRSGEEAFDKINSVRDVWDRLDTPQKRTLIRSVVDKVLIFRDKINIYYRF